MYLALLPTYTILLFIGKRAPTMPKEPSLKPVGEDWTENKRRKHIEKFQTQYAKWKVKVQQVKQVSRYSVQPTPLTDYRSDTLDTIGSNKFSSVDTQ